MSPDSAFSSLSGADIHRIRTRLHYSYAQFALYLARFDPLCSYDRRTLFRWEYGIHRIPTHAALTIVAYAVYRGVA